MPPTFKKAKGYDPALANKTLGSPLKQQDLAGADTAADPDDRQLLISLGLADEREEEAPATAGSVVAAAKALSSKAEQLHKEGSGRIGAFYPASLRDEDTKVPSSSVFEGLRARLEATTMQLLQGQLDDAACAEVHELLLDQQHQIDLLLRGQSSLRGSMNNLRRSTVEKDAKTKALHQHLEEQHGAALKDMEAKLEKAIEQVQQLQQTARHRQQKQTASLQQSLQSASDEASQLQSTARELQAALSSKEQELSKARQVQDNLEAQLAQERAANEAQHASFTQQLQELAGDCQAALAEAQAKATAFAAAQAESQQLAKQVEEAAALQQELTSLSVQLQEQMQQAAAAAQQQQADSAAQKQELLTHIEELQVDLQQAAVLKEEETQQAQQLEKRCQELEQRCQALTEQLSQSCAQVQEVQAQLSAMGTAQGQLSDESAGLQQELVEAVQAKTDLQVQLEQARATSRELQVKLQQAEAALQALQVQHQHTAAQFDGTKQEQQVLQQQLQQLEGQHAQSIKQLEELQAEMAVMKTQLHEAELKAQEGQAKLTEAETDSQQMQWKLAALQTELQKVQRASSATIQQLRQAADDAQAQLRDVQQVANKQVAQAQEAAAQEVELYRQRWRDEFEKRRKLHNQVIELKGNIRVLARIRPMIEKERSAACSEGGSVEAAVRVAGEETVLLGAPAMQREYEFDRVFGPSDGQLQVYEEVSGIVTSIMDGYNACIMAYGQTGSGKTYTIEGPADDPGINSRALVELFKVANERSAEVSYSLSASVLEIYNEQIFDLLAGSKDTGDKLDIKESPSGLFIPNLRIESVCGPEDVAAVLQKGKQNRSTFATNMNEHSSRSHLVLSIYVAARHHTKDTSWSSKLHLIDLAGSERVSRSGAEGDRLKEAAAINKSLSALGDVVAALQSRSSHVPYRNSKLTRLLEDSLGGSSKTLLVVNCSPASENMGETKCSLDFATRARKVELGAAVRASDWSAGGGCNSPTSNGRDSPVPALSSRPSLGQGSTGGTSPSSTYPGSGSTTSSPRISGRYSAAASELRRETISRRAAATSQKDDRQGRE